MNSGKPSRTDIAKLELFATQIEELSCQTPERIQHFDAQDVAGKAEVGLMRLAQEIRESISEFDRPLMPPEVIGATVARV
jgi:hypothetical protein